MSMGCSSSCWTAPFQRYTERQGARILMQAARFFSTSWSASFSATARSGRLVKTSRVLISQSFVDRGIAQAHAQDALQPRVVEPARLPHEGVQGWGDRVTSKLPRNARGPGQSVQVGDEVEPVAHLHLGIVGGVVDTLGRVVVKRTADDRGQVLGVDVAPFR